MTHLRSLAAVALMFTLPACSLFSSGSGDADQYGEGNIPLASPEGMLRDINFAFDSSDLDSGARAKLDNNAQWLKENAEVKVKVEGHCDERGTNEYNLALGERRAQSVVTYLRNAGVKGDQMTPISYGEELPLDSGKGETAWAKNRRAHFSSAK